MALPLALLGAGLVAWAGSQIAREKQVADGYIRHFPGDDTTPVKPCDGAVVCCGIFGLFQHTGIWVDNQIVELNGNGLIRAISPRRFLSNRSGSTIFVACDTTLKPMVAPDAAYNAASRVFQYANYDVLRNNCHRFTLSCLNGQPQNITRFAEFNQAIATLFGQVVHWQPCTIPTYLL